MLKYLLLLMVIQEITVTRPQSLILSKKKPYDDFPSDYSKNELNNFYEVQITDEDMLDGKKFFLTLESVNPGFSIQIVKGSHSKKNKAYVVMELTTTNGNIGLVVSDDYFGEKLKFFKESGVMRFLIKNDNEEFQNQKYTIKTYI